MSDKNLYIVGVAGVTLGGSSVYTDGLASFHVLGGNLVQKHITTGSRIVYLTDNNKEESAVVLWPETFEKVITIMPDVTRMVEDNNGLGAAVDEPQAKLSLDR